MFISDVSFRDIFHKFVFVRDSKILSQSADLFDIPEGTNAMLMYCYIDCDAGITFELLCPATFESKKYYPMPDKNFRHFVRYNALDKNEIYIVSDDEIDISFFDIETARINENYDHGYSEVIRGIDAIDPLRSPEFPDDIMVYITKENVQTERVWVKTLSIDDGHIKGRLLNEPNSDFGIHKGDEFIIQLVTYKGELVAVCPFK